MTQAEGMVTMATSSQTASRLEPPPLTRFDEEMMASLRLMQRQEAARPVWTVDWILTTATKATSALVAPYKLSKIGTHRYHTKQVFDLRRSRSR
jgi:hypothetical protein